MYESYVKDLSEQNEVLVQTVEQLETEANSRVTSLEAKLNKAVSTAKVWLNVSFYESNIFAACMTNLFTIISLNSLETGLTKIVLVAAYDMLYYIMLLTWHSLYWFFFNFHD